MSTPLVLVIEDDVSLLLLLRYVLEKQGFRILTASDGLEGIDLAQQHPPDLIISDFNVAGANGAKVFERLHSMLKTTRTRFVLMAAYPSTLWETSAVSSLADAFLFFPSRSSLTP